MQWSLSAAFDNLPSFEIILIAGKGHETYQDLGKKRIFLSDKNIVKNFKIKNDLFDKKNNYSKYNGQILKSILKTKKNLLFDQISINSRTIKKNDLFFEPIDIGDHTVPNGNSIMLKNFARLKYFWV